MITKTEQTVPVPTTCAGCAYQQQPRLCNAGPGGCRRLQEARSHNDIAPAALISVWQCRICDRCYTSGTGSAVTVRPKGTADELPAGTVQVGMITCQACRAVAGNGGQEQKKE